MVEITPERWAPSALLPLVEALQKSLPPLADHAHDTSTGASHAHSQDSDQTELCFHQEIKAFLSVTFFQPPGCWIPGAVGIIPIDLQTRADSQRWGRGQDWGWWWWWWGG